MLGGFHIEVSVLMTTINLSAIVGARYCFRHIRRLSPQSGYQVRIHINVVFNNVQ